MLLKVESASRRNEVAIGYKIKGEENNPNKNHGIYINPKKSRIINFSDRDSVIVLAKK